MGCYPPSDSSVFLYEDIPGGDGLKICRFRGTIWVKGPCGGVHALNHDTARALIKRLSEIVGPRELENQAFDLGSIKLQAETPNGNPVPPPLAMALTNQQKSALMQVASRLVGDPGRKSLFDAILDVLRNATTLAK